MSDVLYRIDKYLQQLSPHMMEREGVVLLKEAAQEIQRLTSDLDGMTAAASSLEQDVYSLTEHSI